MKQHERNLDRPLMMLQPEDMNEEFSCIQCGNTAHSAGFFPCDEKGAYIEPEDLAWVGIYRCDGCGQRYWPRSNDNG